MRQQIRSHLTYANVMVTILAFIVLGGGAYAALRLPKNSVTSRKIENGQVKRPDLAANAVNGRKVANNSLTTADINDATLTSAWSKLTGVPAGFADGVDNTGGTATDVACSSPCVDGSEVVDDSLTGADVNDNSLTGADVNDDSLTGADVNESSLGQVPSAVLGGVGRSLSGGSCNPSSTTYVDCGFTTLNLPSATRVLILTSFSYGANGSANGTCRLATSSGSLTATARPLYAADERTSSLTVVTDPIGPGSVDFGLECNQQSGDIYIARVEISAVALSSS